MSLRHPLLFLALLLASFPACAAPPARNFHSLSAPSLEGDRVGFHDYRGKVLLVVNVASHCGYTPQYEGLQRLQEEYGPRGFLVLAFPSNDFGGQEPGTPAEIRAFCERNYQVSFPLFAKVVTQPGPEQSPVYRYLGERSGELPSWNFCKYLIDRNGEFRAYFPSPVTPEDPALRAALEGALG